MYGSTNRLVKKCRVTPRWHFISYPPRTQIHQHYEQKRNTDKQISTSKEKVNSVNTCEN